MEQLIVPGVPSCDISSQLSAMEAWREVGRPKGMHCREGGSYGLGCAG
jgi:hypothetical protein